MPETTKEAIMAKSKKRTAARSKSPSKRSKISSKRTKASVKRSPRMAAKRAPSKKTKSKLRRVIQTAMEPMVQNRESTAPVEPAAPVEAVVLEATTVIAVERAVPDTVVVEHEAS